MIHNAPLVIMLAPLVAAILTALPAGWIGRKVYGLSVLLHVAALGVAAWVLREVATPGHGPLRLDILSFGGRVPVVFSVDRLAAVMMVVITGFGTLINHYSVRYMQSEAGRARFHSLLGFAIVVLIGMVSSANLLMLMLFWQLLSWLLSLLA